jgi:integrase
MLRLTLPQITDRGLRAATSKTGKRLRFRWTWALRTVIASAQALPRPRESLLLFVNTDGGQWTSRGFKSAWQRAMKKWVAAGHERFWENDIRAKSASDTEDLLEAQQRLGHETPRTTQRHYRRGETKVRPLR